MIVIKSETMNSVSLKLTDRRREACYGGARRLMPL